MDDLVSKAEAFARTQHGNHMYGEHPYAYHLEMVAGIAKNAGASEIQIAAAWLHDVIEDTSTTKQEVQDLFGSEVAAIVWALTGIGSTRLERMTDAIEKIKATPGAGLVKLADRYANVSASVMDSQTKFAKRYIQEQDMLRPALPQCDLLEMLEDLVKIAKLSVARKEAEQGKLSD